MKNQKGITLIALVITIIVLLILAGITIAMLSATDSAPAKANEAAQKNDIGSAKDKVYLTAQDAQVEAYTNTYINSVSTAATNTLESSTTKKLAIGKAVADAVVAKYEDKKENADNRTVGKATITATKNTTTGDATIVITTTDFSVTGTIDASESGVLTWENYVGR